MHAKDFDMILETSHIEIGEVNELWNLTRLALDILFLQMYRSHSLLLGRAHQIYDFRWTWVKSRAFAESISITSLSCLSSPILHSSLTLLSVTWALSFTWQLKLFRVKKESQYVCVERCVLHYLHSRLLFPFVCKLCTEYSFQSSTFLLETGCLISHLGSDA